MVTPEPNTINVDQLLKYALAATIGGIIGYAIAGRDDGEQQVVVIGGKRFIAED